MTMFQERPSKPDVYWLTDQVWAGCHDLEEILPCFQSITTDITKIPINCQLENVEVDVNPREWNGYVDPTEHFEMSTNNDEEPKVCLSWNDRLTTFQKLILIKCFKEEKVC